MSLAGLSISLPAQYHPHPHALCPCIRGGVRQDRDPLGRAATRAPPPNGCHGGVTPAAGTAGTPAGQHRPPDSLHPPSCAREPRSSSRGGSNHASLPPLTNPAARGAEPAVRRLFPGGRRAGPHSAGRRAQPGRCGAAAMSLPRGRTGVCSVGLRDGCSGGSGAAAGLSRLLGSGVTRGDGRAVAQPAGRGLRAAGRASAARSRPRAALLCACSRARELQSPGRACGGAGGEGATGR